MTRTRFFSIGALIGTACGAVYGYSMGVATGLILPNLILSGVCGCLLGLIGARVGLAMQTRQRN